MGFVQYWPEGDYNQPELMLIYRQCWSTDHLGRPNVDFVARVVINLFFVPDWPCATSARWRLPSIRATAGPPITLVATSTFTDYRRRCWITGYNIVHLFNFLPDWPCATPTRRRLPLIRATVGPPTTWVAPLTSTRTWTTDTDVEFQAII